MQAISITGIPTEAGTHFPGQSKAPEAIISSGLISALKDVGYHIESQANIFEEDARDGSAVADAARWKPTEKIRGVRNEDATLSVLRFIANELQRRRLVGIDVQDSAFPIILGGDCSSKSER